MRKKLVDKLSIFPKFFKNDFSKKTGLSTRKRIRPAGSEFTGEGIFYSYYNRFFGNRSEIQRIAHFEKYCF
jgi:hypothetical protein